MTGGESLLAAFLGGVLTSASPCVLMAVPVAVGYVGGQAATARRAWVLALVFIAGMNVALLALGLMAARLGLLLGTLPGPWSIAVGTVLIGTAAWIWRSRTGPGFRLPERVQSGLAGSGAWGGLVLGALIGTVMSPCATPALAAAMVLAGSGSALGAPMWRGAAALLAYGLGHSILLLAAGALPSVANGLVGRFSRMQAWLPGRRTFSTLLAAAGAWWMWQGLDALA